MSTLRSCILAFSLALPFLHTGPARANPDMHLDMAIHYGNNLVSHLGTQIMLDGQRRSIARHNQSKGGTSAPREKWPAHITERTIGQHVFSLEELRAMRDSDPDRMRSLMRNREITVQGEVRHIRRVADPRITSFRLVIPANSGSESSFSAFSHYGTYNPMPYLPEEGSIVQIRGVPDVKLRNSVSFRGAKILSGQQARSRQPTSAPASASSSNSNSNFETAAYANAQAAAAARSTTAPNPSKLRFTPSAAVTRELNARITQALSGGLAKGRKPEELRQLLDKGTLHQAFAQIVKPHGLSDRDLGDVFAATLIISWQVIHESEEENRPAIEAVRKAMRDSMSRVKWIDLLNDAQKQTIAETLIVSTMINLDRYATGKHQGNRQLVRAAKQDTELMVRSISGMDLTRYHLTSQGFQPR